MAGKIPSDDCDEVFVLETKSTTSETKTVMVEIHDFTKKIENEQNKHKPIDSPSFNMVGKKLAVRVYPEEAREDSPGVGVYLMNQNKEQITATATIATKIKNWTMPKGEIEPGEGRGYACFLTHEEYRKWHKENDDIFKLKVNITLHFSEKKSSWTNKGKPRIEFDPLEIALAKCNIRDDKILTDFTVVSQDGGRFACNRIFLATQSPVMMAMMTHDMKEKQESELTLEYSEEVVKHFVDFFYTGKVPPKVLEENLESFLALAECYDLKPLKLQTEEAAIDKITVGNMITMFALADRYNAENLKEVAEFVIKSNKNILKDQDLSTVPTDVFTEVFRLLC